MTKKKGKKKKTKPGSKCVVIMIVQGHALPFKTGANSDKSVAPDQVCWANADTLDYNLRFISGWPFEGTPVDIAAAALKVTKWMKVKTGAGANKEYIYRVLGTPTTPPPDGPAVITDQ